MKATQIVYLLLVLLIGGYLLWFHSVNPSYVRLPMLISLPPALVVLLAMVLVWLLTWLALQPRVWSLGRENRKLKSQLAELEHKLIANAAPQPPVAPVIPDRSDGWQTEGDLDERRR